MSVYVLVTLIQNVVLQDVEVFATEEAVIAYMNDMKARRPRIQRMPDAHGLTWKEEVSEGGPTYFTYFMAHERRVHS